jgi:Methionyl-tRNA synthetase
MSRKNFQGCVPPSGKTGDQEKELHQSFANGVKKCHEYIIKFQPHRTLEHVALLSSKVNKYIDTCKPWILTKDEKDRERLGTVLYTALDMSRIIVGLLDPVMPKKMCEARINLGLGKDVIPFSSLSPGLLVPGTELPIPSPLFPKIQLSPTDLVNVKNQQPKNSLNNSAPEENKWIAINDFQKIELKVGHIKSCRKVEKSNKLLCSEVDLGETRLRSIISGAAEFYSAEEMTGRQVIVVANLKPVKLMGHTSEGVLLKSAGIG